MYSTYSACDVFISADEINGKSFRRSLNFPFLICSQKEMWKDEEPETHSHCPGARSWRQW